MMNIKKHDLCLLMLHEFKFRHNASKTVANINRAWGDGYTSDWTVRRCSQKFRSVDLSLEDEKGREQVCSLDNKQLQELLSKILDKVPK